MKLLLSDASGLTARQVATQATAAGHTVEAVSPARFCLGRFTRHVHRIHRVPAFGEDPEGWLEATLSVLRAGSHDVLVPTQEQVALLAREPGRVRELGTAVAVPPFSSLLRVQDKLAQAQTLAELGLPHPQTWVASSLEQLLARAEPPVYLKAPIGTASNGVCRAGDRAALVRAASGLDFARGIVVQQAVRGRLAMVQGVFESGALVAFHALVREREGSAGGAAVKRSILAPQVREHVQALGEALNWHGALSLDAILAADGPCYIDINPRLVEPGNAWRAGVDLLAALLAVATGRRLESAPCAAAGVRTHQLLIGILGAAQHAGRRPAIGRELASAIARRGPYAGSEEELTPLAGDGRAAVPVVAAAALTLLRPPAWRLFTTGAVSAYALTPAAWDRIAAGPGESRDVSS